MDHRRRNYFWLGLVGLFLFFNVGYNKEAEFFLIVESTYL